MEELHHRSVNWDHEKVERALLCVDNFSGVLLDRYGQIFEEYSGKKIDSSSNLIIAGDWLYKFFHSIIGTYELVNISQTRGKTSPIPIFPLSANFSEQSAKPLMWDHLYFMMTTLLDGKDPKIEWANRRNKIASPKVDILISLKNSIGNNSTAGKKVSFANTRFCLGQNRFETVCVQFGLKKWSNVLFFPAAFVAQDANINFREYQFKNWQNSNTGLNEVVSLCLKLLPLYIPLELLEARTSIKDQAMSLGFHRTPFLFSSGGLHDNPLFKNVANEWRADGTKLLYHQHGGMYGMAKRVAAEDYERKAADHFFTWGWTDEGHNNSALRPGIQKRKLNKTVNNTLLVCLDMPRFPYQICYAPMPNRVEKLMSETETFLKHFDGTISVNPYHSDYGNNMFERVFRAKPSAKLERSRSVIPYHKYSLIVCNYLGSTWIESIGYGTPTICFFDDKIYKFRDSMLGVIEEMLHVGILHTSAKSAAIFASKISNDPYGWWQSDDVEIVRKVLHDNWGGFGEDWKNEWQQELTTFSN